MAQGLNQDARLSMWQKALFLMLTNAGTSLEELEAVHCRVTRLSVDHLRHNQERAGKNFLHSQSRNHYAGPASSGGKGELAAKHHDLSSILGTHMMGKRTQPPQCTMYTHIHTYKIC